MKIAIISVLSLPVGIPMNEYFSSKDPIIYKTEHPHPWIANLAQGLANIDGNEVYVISLLNDINRNINFNYNNVHYCLIKSSFSLYKAIKYLISTKNKKQVKNNDSTLLSIHKNIIRKSYNQFKYHLSFVSNKCKVHKILNKIKPDIVHGQGISDEGYYAITSKFPCVITSHGQIGEYFTSSKKNLLNIDCYLQKYKENRVIRKIRYAIGVSPNCTNNLLKYINKKHVYLVDNAISELFFRERKLSFNNTVLYIGSVQERKQTMELIKAVEMVPEIELNIFSFTTSGEYYDMVVKYINNNKLGNRIRLMGYRNQKDLVEEISKCLCVCLPSLYESFGMTIAEAMAVGKPVIASDLEATRYVVKDHVTGLLFEPGNIKQLSEKIRYLLNNKKYAKQIGKNGKEEALNRWHPHVIANKTLNLYKYIISEW